MMKKILTAIPLTFSILFFGACNNQDGPSYDPSIVVPHKDSGTGNTGNAQTIIPADSMQPAQPSAQAVNAQAQPAVAAGMNPAHGQPGHRCDIAVGAPLNSAPAKPVSTPVQPENKAAAASPDVAPTVPANTDSEKKP